MTNDAVRAVVITGRYAVWSSPREKRNSEGEKRTVGPSGLRLTSVVLISLTVTTFELLMFLLFILA